MAGISEILKRARETEDMDSAAALTSLHNTVNNTVRVKGLRDNWTINDWLIFARMAELQDEIRPEVTNYAPPRNGSHTPDLDRLETQLKG